MQKPLIAVLISVLLSVVLTTAKATQFVPLSIEKQVEEADFAVEASLESLKVFKNSSGFITSHYTFAVNEGFGFSDSKFFLDLPGGTLDGVTTAIDGSPHFAEGEKTFLLLKKIEGKIYLSNFTLGEYKIIETDGKVFYRSEVFPHDPRAGIISKEKMKLLMNEKWKYSSKDRDENYVFEKNVRQSPPNFRGKKTERLPAQKTVQTQKENNFEKIIIAVSIITFVLAFWILLRKKKL